MKNKVWKKVLSSVTATAVMMSSIMLTSMPSVSAAFNAPAADTGAVGGISNGGDWTIYASKSGHLKGGNTITDVTDTNGVVEVNGRAAYGAAFQFDLASKANNSAAEGKVIKDAKLRTTLMIYRNTKHKLFRIDDSFTDNISKVPLYDTYDLTHGSGNDFWQDSANKAMEANGAYPEALKKWQIDLDVTGEVIRSNDKVSFYIEANDTSDNKTEYATCNIAKNGRLTNDNVPFLYNSGATDYSKWVYPQIVFTYTDEQNYKDAYADFTAASAALAAAAVTESGTVTAPASANGAAVTLAAADSTGAVTVENNIVSYNPSYAGDAAKANVKLTVTKGAASYSAVIPLTLDVTPSYAISFDGSKNPKGEIAVTVGDVTSNNGTAYAKEGETVTIAPGANTGYTAAVTVKKASDGSEIAVNNNSFTMPPEPVNVGVAYSKPAAGTTRIAATNSIAVRNNGGATQGNNGNFTIGANRMLFVKFDLTGYNKDVISEAKLKFTNANAGRLQTKALFHVPNNEWNESNFSKDFRFDGTDDTKLSAFKNGDETIALYDSKTLIIPECNEEVENADLSAAATGILKDYYIGCTGTDTAEEFDVTNALKTALSRSESGTVTLMVLSPYKNGRDYKSVTNAESLDRRPSLTITEKAAGTVTADSSLEGKITVPSGNVTEGTEVTVTLTDTEKYVKNSLTASFVNSAGQTRAVPLTAGADNSFRFTMPAGNVTLSAMYNTAEGVTTIAASDDYCYNVQAKSANKGHYIRNQSDSDEKNLALGFDLSGIDLSNKSVVLKLIKTGYSGYTATKAYLIGSNPWASGSFDYTAASSAAIDVTTEDKGTSAAQGVCQFVLDTSKLTLVDGKLYLNVEKTEQAAGQSGNDYYAIPSADANDDKKATFAQYLPQLELTEIIPDTPHAVTAIEGITASQTTAMPNTEVVLSGNYAAGSLFVTSKISDSSSELLPLIEKENGTYSFIMPNNDVEVTGLVNTEDKIFVVADSAERVKTDGETDNNNYYIQKNKGIGLTFTIPDSVMALAGEGEEITAKLHFMRSNGATNQKTNIYKQDSFTYVDTTDAAGYIDQYGGGSISAQDIPIPASAGTYKLLMAYDSSVADNASGNDYYVVNAANGKSAGSISELPYIVFSVKKVIPMPDKEAPSYPQIEDNGNTQEAVFQYHYAGGLTTYNNGTTETGKAYDAYLWVPQNTAPGQLKGIVAIKLNLVEVPLANSDYLRRALADKGFGIMFYVGQKDPYGYNNVLNDFRTKEVYKRNGDGTYTKSANTSVGDLTTDGKDASQILNEILAGLAEASGYSELNNVPMITIGHSAAAGFGNKIGNFDPNRVIAGIHMKNGMSSGSPVEGVPVLQYAAQYTEHSNGSDRDRSVRDARYHITNERNNTNNLVSHIIEWGSGHYDWSDNATYMITEYIKAAIDARLPQNYSETHTLNNLINTGYIMKPFEKDSYGAEQEAGYYRDYLQGWLSSGQNNAAASDTDKKASFWFFSEELADKINKFTNYAIPESPDSIGTGVNGKTYSEIEPFMLMRDTTFSSNASRNDGKQNLIDPLTNLGSSFSRYGQKRFVNYDILAYPNADPSNAANLGGYGDLTIDTYYMSKIPSLDHEAFENTGAEAYVPQNQKAEFVPIIAPYEVVSSELLNIGDMTVNSENAEAANAASVTRTKLRFHNNRVYYHSGNKTLNAPLYGDQAENSGEMDSYGFIKSPEVRGENGFVTSAFKAMSSQMTVPYVTKGDKQTLTVNDIEDVAILGSNGNPTLDVTYTSSDEDLQKYTDVAVDYGPAKAVRTVNADGSYSWKIEVLKDQIPANAVYPIEVNVIVSNLGKWEKVWGAAETKTFNIYYDSVPDKNSVIIDSVEETADEMVVTVNGDNLKGKNGVLIAVAYDNNNRCVQAEIMTGTTAALKKIDSGYIKVFMWNSLSGENSMQPVLKPAAAEIKKQP